MNYPGDASALVGKASPGCQFCQDVNVNSREFRKVLDGLDDGLHTWRRSAAPRCTVKGLSLTFWLCRASTAQRGCSCWLCSLCGTECINSKQNETNKAKTSAHTHTHTFLLLPACLPTYLITYTYVYLMQTPHRDLGTQTAVLGFALYFFVLLPDISAPGSTCAGIQPRLV